MDTCFQAILQAPGFRVGIRCDEMEVHSLVYLEPGAGTSPENALAAETLRQLQTYLDDPDAVFSLPLRPSGTAFQRRVWAEIADIPCHQVRTYGELATRLHNAPRAVGQACGANPFPLIVPCHRVVAAHGGLGGFARQRGGFLVEVKRWLLTHEGI
jgi:methylated-DNA-[protein]-cysteine S-methyltransferase